MRLISCLALTALGLGTARAEDAQQVHPETLYLGAGITHDTLGAVGDELDPQSPQDYGAGTRSGSGFAAGAGWQWHFGRVGMRMEYDLERVATTTSLRVVSLSVLLDLL